MPPSLTCDSLALLASKRADAFSNGIMLSPTASCFFQRPHASSTASCFFKGYESTHRCYIFPIIVCANNQIFLILYRYKLFCAEAQLHLSKDSMHMCSLPKVIIYAETQPHLRKDSKPMRSLHKLFCSEAKPPLSRNVQAILTLAFGLHCLLVTP